MPRPSPAPSPAPTPLSTIRARPRGRQWRTSKALHSSTSTIRMRRARGRCRMGVRRLCSRGRMGSRLLIRGNPREGSHLKGMEASRRMGLIRTRRDRAMVVRLRRRRVGIRLRDTVGGTTSDGRDSRCWLALRWTLGKV